VVKKSLFTWWLQYRKLQVMFKVPPRQSPRHLVTRRTVFLKIVFSIARYTFRMCSVMAIFRSSVVCTVIVRCTETFWSPCIMSTCLYFAFFYSVLYLYRWMWVPVTTAWRVLRLRMEERSPVWRVAVNKLNKQSRTADEGWSCSLGVGRGANNSSP
jgi:hypothetical protein